MTQFAHPAKLAPSKRKKHLPNVNFVLLEQLLKTKRNPAPLALVGSTKTATPKPPPCAKHARPVFIPSIPPHYARIAKKARFKNWLNPSNTIVNFVPPVPLSKTKRNPAPLAWVGNIKKAAL